MTESVPSDPNDQRNIGQYVNVRSFPPGNGTLTLGVHYTDDDVEEAGVDEDSLRLYQFTDGEWTELPESAVDTDANVVSMNVDNLSVLATESVVAPLGRIDADADDANASDDGMAGGDKSNDKHSDDASDGNDSDTDGDVVDVGAKDIVIDLGDVTIADFDLRGPVLPDTHIDHRTYEVGGFDIAIDGLDLAIRDTHYRVGHITIEVDPFDVILDDVTLDDGE